MGQISRTFLQKAFGLLLLTLLGSPALFSEGPAVSEAPKNPQTPGSPYPPPQPLPPVNPQASGAPDALTTARNTKGFLGPWTLLKSKSSEGTTIWNNSQEIPFKTGMTTWDPFQLLIAGPGGYTAYFTTPQNNLCGLTLDPGAQAWWSDAPRTNTLNLRIPTGGVRVSTQGSKEGAQTLQGQELQASFTSASFSFFQEPNGDFLLLCYGGQMDVQSENYKFRMISQRGYERVGGKARYFEVPMAQMSTTIKNWKEKTKEVTSQGLNKLLDDWRREAPGLEEKFKIFQGWAGELQYWQNRLLLPQPLTQGETTQALGRLEAPWKGWTTLVTRLEGIAGNLDLALKEPHPSNPRQLNQWAKERPRWHNLLSQFRFALGIYNRLSAPLVPTPQALPQITGTVVPGQSSQNPLKDLMDPTAALKSILEGLNFGESNPGP